MCYEGVYFLRRNLNFWPYLVKLHEKKFGTIQKFLPCSPWKTCLFKLLLFNNFNGFFYIEFNQTLDILQSKSYYFLSKSPTKLQCDCCRRRLLLVVSTFALLFTKICSASKYPEILVNAALLC